MRNILLILIVMTVAGCDKQMDVSVETINTLALGDSDYSIHVPEVPYVIQKTDGYYVQSALPNPDRIAGADDWLLEIVEQGETQCYQDDRGVWNCIPDRSKEGSVCARFAKSEPVILLETSQAMAVANPTVLVDSGLGDEYTIVAYGKYDFILSSALSFRCEDECFCSPHDEGECQISKDECEQCRSQEIEENRQYILCAERRASSVPLKRVIIFLKQVTDNPSFATQIFETFRWRK